MKKIFKKSLLFIVIVVAVYGLARFADIFYGSYVFVERQPYMVMQTPNAVTFKWQTPKEEIGTLSYGLSAGELDKNISEPNAVDKHSLTLSDLEECSQYFYAINSSSLTIDNTNRSFTTPCKNAEFQRIWAIGDSGKRGKDQQAVYEQMLSYLDHNLSQLNMWILLGDNAYTSGTQKDYNEGMFEAYPEMLKRFAPWALMGNHDARRWAFYDIFDFPVNGENGGLPSGDERYYSVEDGNLHLVMLDNETADLSADGAMASWLKKDLAANTKPWVIVAFHTPPYTDGGHHSDSSYDSGGRLQKMRENFVPIFDAYGVDLVLSGHSHDYERSLLMRNHLGKSDTFDAQTQVLQNDASCYTKPLKATPNSGTIYQVCGSSSKLDKAALKHPALPFSFQEMGSLILEITPTTLTSKFLNIHGKISDQFTIHKNNTICGDKKNEQR
ncbi:metallophosphoesterase [bacterium]|nr:metallophosphoesterase [bacterium]MBU1434616.1 metallophosphoesterase [bacterium]MBU1502194.1 metallophosphoesterase [bacterium]